MRSKRELDAAENEASERLWYYRHDELHAGAGAAAEQIRERYGFDSLQLDPLQAARLEGKLSALRWALGDEWDNLDT